MTKLHLIQGGRRPKEQCPRQFYTAICTDTRLMGVVGLHVHWKILNSPEATDLHQFFYLDCEEYGIESYVPLWSDDETQIQAHTRSLMGPLGGRPVSLDQRQATALVSSCATLNRARGELLPFPQEEYADLLDPVTLSDAEMVAYWDQICEPLSNDHQVIHYFLMRLFAGDLQAAAHLAGPSLDVNHLAMFPASTLCRNTIQPRDASYLCESLVETDHLYRIIVSELSIRDRQVTRFRPGSDFSVSAQEAAMQLSRPEYISLYDLNMDPGEFPVEQMEGEWETMATRHDHGIVFMLFHEDNSHTEKAVYRLDDDILGAYYVTEFGQCLAVAYDLPAIHRLERQLFSSSIGSTLSSRSKYEFSDPTFYDFVQGDFEDFEEFVQTIRLDP